MIVTAEANGRNRRLALVTAGLTAWAAGLLVWLSPPLWPLLGLSPCAYWWVRRRCLRRMAVMQQPFPKVHIDEQINAAISLLSKKLHAVLVEEDSKIVGILTSYDVIEYMSR